jgi:hypothetical protein
MLTERRPSDSPESDWLWLWAEAGWPAIVLLSPALRCSFDRCFPPGGHESTFPARRFDRDSSSSLHGLWMLRASIGTAFAGIFLLSMALKIGAVTSQRSLVVIFVCWGCACPRRERLSSPHVSTALCRGRWGRE